ncbi:MAG TPA: hypothetical protein VF764_12830 [Steroidobacteraceae bacterium]
MADAQDRYYPKQKLSDAMERDRGSVFSRPLFSRDIREEVRSGEFPPYNERQSRESREGLRAWNDREIAYRVARQAMDTRTGRKSGRITR